MDRSRRGTGKQGRPQPPSSSRLTVKPRGNRKRPESLWTRLPKPAIAADACGKALRRALPVVAGASVLFALGGTAWAGYRFVTTSPRFAVTTIEITGNGRLTDDAILASTPVRIGDNVFATNLDDVTSELRKNPWIASATAHRVLPHTIKISVREHEPAAIIHLGGRSESAPLHSRLGGRSESAPLHSRLGGLYLADADGHPFKRIELGAEADDGAGLPIITGLDRNAYAADPAGSAASIRGALAALGRWRTDSERPSIGEVHLDANGALTLVTYEHAISIQLGIIDDELPLRMQTFDATWADLSPGERARARAIHLDARPDHVTVALKKDS